MVGWQATGSERGGSPVVLPSEENNICLFVKRRPLCRSHVDPKSLIQRDDDLGYVCLCM